MNLQNNLMYGDIKSPNKYFFWSDKACLWVDANKCLGCFVHCSVDYVRILEIIINAPNYFNTADVIFKSHKFNGVTCFIPVVH